MFFCERLPTSRNPKVTTVVLSPQGFSCAIDTNDSAGQRQNNNDDESTTGAVELAGGNVHLVTTMEQWEQMTSEANKDGKIVVPFAALSKLVDTKLLIPKLMENVSVNFSAAWCNPCRQIASAYRELADKYPSILFITVDVDELAEFSSSWDIKATPTFFFLRDGQQFDKFIGANKEDLQKKMMLIADQSSMRSPN